MGSIGSLFDRGLLAGKYVPRIYAYYFKQWQGFDMAFHRHDSTEIMYVIQGDCKVEIERDTGRAHSVTLKKGEFILLDASVPHRLVVDKTCRMLNAEFGFAEYAEAFPSVGELAAEEKELADLMEAPASFFVLQDPEDVYHSLKSLVVELDRRGRDGGALDRMLFMQLLVRIGRLRRNTGGEGGQQAEMYVNRGKEFLLQNYDRNVLVQDVASHVNLHPGYLHRIFKEIAKETITSYLTRIRIDKAKMLLLHTTIPIADISDYVGIGSRQYFHAVFKKHTGNTPTEFRNSMEAWQRDYEES